MMPTLSRLWALTLKNIRQRTRKPFLLIFEIAFCFGWFLVLFFLRNSIDYALEKSIPQQTNEPIKLFTRIKKPICYTPNLPWTDEIMKSVATTLNIKSPARNVKICDMSANETSKYIGMISFKNTDQVLPEHLDYEIGATGAGEMIDFEALDTAATPHSNFGEKYKIFAALQGAINKAFIELRSGKNITQEFTTEEFPFPESKTVDPEVIAAIFIWFALVTWFSLLPTTTMVVGVIVSEKLSGICELIKMFGVAQRELWASYIIERIPIFFVFTVGNTIFMSFVIHKSLMVIIFITFVLYFCIVIAFSFLLGSLMPTQNYLGVIVVMLDSMAFMATTTFWHVYPTKSFVLHYLQSFLPHSTMFWFWQQVAFFESTGKGAQISNLFSSGNPLCPSIGQCWLLMMIQSMVLMTAANSLSKIFPGKYGVPVPWRSSIEEYIDIVRSLFGSSKVEAKREDEAEAVMRPDPEFFEAGPGDVPVGVAVKNVSKEFGSTVALSDVTFKVYKGEVTVLLGHNGAGKTTIMSIITGMYGATRGHVYIDGEDIKMSSACRNKIGLCPQHNLTFENLNVQEHVIFFGMLKGMSASEAKKNSNEILEKLNLSEKKNVMSEKLSGGMRRRLQLACALAGNAEILVLDEPTSGLDVQTRRELWDLILGLRGERSVLLSTHFMEEADALADRVVALNTGRLVAHATPMYLKRALGTGFTLTVNLQEENKSDQISDVIKERIPSSSIRKSTKKFIQFTLPSKETNNFAEMFQKLEDGKEDLGIESLAIGVTTLEEVFLRICSDTDEEQNGAIPRDISEPNFKPVRAPMLWFNQAHVLLRRQAKHVWQTKYTFLVWNVIVPIAGLCFMTHILTEEYASASDDASHLRITLDMYPKTEDNKVFYSVSDEYKQGLEGVKKNFPKVTFEEGSSITYDILRVGANKAAYNKLYVGFELTETKANALYTTLVRHALPVSLDLIFNTIASAYLGPSDKKYINTVNVIEIKNDTINNHAKSHLHCTSWTAMYCLFAFGFLNISVPLLVKERLNGVRHSHRMAGCSAALHWIVTTVWFTLLFMSIIVIPTIFGLYVFETDYTLTRIDFIGMFFAISMLAGLANLAFIYCLTFFSNSETGLQSGLLFLSVIYGCIIPLLSIGIPNQGLLGTTITRLGNIFPQFHTYGIIYRLTENARHGTQCTLNYNLCRNGILPLPGFSLEQMQECCTNRDLGILDKVDDEAFNIVNSTIYLGLCLIMYMVLTVLLDEGIVNYLYDKVMNLKYVPPEKKFNDPSVEEERKYVENKIHNLSSTSPQAEDFCLVGNVHKRYKSIFCKKVDAVRGISFSVKRGECFGLLGVNGAGKTTMFKMLVAAESRTRGKIQASTYDQDKNKKAFLSNLAYCPQFGGIDEFMSCRANLATILTLRGLPRKLVEMEVKKWLDIVGLSKAKGNAGSYSGGKKRRAATCVALAGANEGAALLDEPTAGVDPAAAKHMWQTIPKSNLTLLLTSHSMQETEAMCTRLGIVAKGELGALGTPGQLRASRASGYTAVLKLRPSGSSSGDEVDSDRTGCLKRDFAEMFPSRLQDEHEAMLHYHITDPDLKYSELFRSLEEMKSRYSGILEDYSISNCTLEEVFLSFAKDSDVRKETKEICRRRKAGVNDTPV